MEHLQPTPRTSPPREVIARYKRLADFERGFRVPKSKIEIPPSSTACPTASAPMPRSA